MRNNESAGKVAFAASQYGKEKEYWLNKFAGELKKTNFPYDRSPTGMDKGESNFVNISFPGETATGLIQLSKDIKHRLYMILAAGLVTLLYKYSRNDDIIMGSPIFKQEIEGEFINTVLPLRIQVNECITFKELLLQVVRPSVTEATQHQNYPIETLLFQLGMPYTGKEFPLFDVVILLENIQYKKYIRHVHPNIIFAFLQTGVDSINGELEYNPRLYNSRTAERMVLHFKRLMEVVVSNIDIRVSAIDILAEEEKKQLLVHFNGSQTWFPAESTIQQLFEDQVTDLADEIALTYEEEFFTYNSLNEEANRLALFLKQKECERGEPVGVMVKNSPQAVISLLGILKVGGAYLPLNAEYPWERKKYMLNDCNARLLLTNCNEAYTLQAELTLLDLDNRSLFEHLNVGNPGSCLHGNDLAYIMYTSGSTGIPKGVMVDHRNVIRLVRNTDFISFKKGDSLMLTGALEFDASTFEIWGPLLNGFTLHLVNKDKILNPDELKEAVRKKKVSMMWMTAPLFNQLVEADIEIFATVGSLLVGGDVLSPLHIFRVKKQFPGLNVINGYGPTENTTFSTTFLVGKEYRNNIPIGKPIAHSTVYILDVFYHLVPVGVPGDLYVGGDGLSRGYLNNPELTGEKFLFDRSYISYMTYIPGRLYKTGDLARWLPEGNIEFLGRLDYQVKIRGYRIEPGEIENRLRQIDYIIETVVIEKKNKNDEKYLCAYLVLVKDERRSFDAVELRKALSLNLPDYMVPAHFVQMEKIPLTFNGKVDRKALPDPVINMDGVAFAAPRNPVEKKIIQIWSEVLRVEKEKISIDSNFFDLGGHSLKATILIAKLNKAFDVKVPLAELFRIPTIRELAEFVRKLEKDAFLSIKAVEKKEYYQLSAAQRRLYFLHQFEPGITVYNVLFTTVLQGELNRQDIAEAFKKLLERHESLRTSFQLINDIPVQKVHDHVELEIEYSSIAAEVSEDKGNSGEFAKNKDQGVIRRQKITFGTNGLDTGLEQKPKSQEPAVKSYIMNFIRPIDLSLAPLLRVGLLKIETKQYVLVVDMHHIITDGTSMHVLIYEFIRFYEGKELPILRLQYKDYSEWQNNEAHNGIARLQKGYWLKQFAGEIPVLNLPLDFSRPANQSFVGNTLEFQLPAEQARELHEFSLRTGTTLFMVILAAYVVLLSKLSGQEDIVVGTPIAARRHADLEKIIGMFVNTLALRCFPIAELTFGQFLEDIKSRTLEAFENQEYQFEDLVEAVMVNRDISRNPIFDVMFVLQNMDDGYERGGDEEVDRESANSLDREPVLDDHEHILDTAKFDLTLTGLERGDGLYFSIQYCRRLFKKETVERFVEYFRKIVSMILSDVEIRISEIEIISSREKKRLLEDFNRTKVKYPQEKMLHQLFEEQVQGTPDYISVIAPVTGFSDETVLQITYAELNKRSDRLAKVLVTKGVLPDTIISLMVERRVDMIIGILGILKSGGAYLPIDTSYPEERKNFMMEDSRAKILITSCFSINEVKKAGTLEDRGEVRSLGERENIEVLLFEDLNFSESFWSQSFEATSSVPFTFSPTPSHPFDLAYIIFTSGSTGRPKGVMVEHSSVVNLLCAQTRFFKIGGNDRVLQFSSFCFDASVEQIFIALVNGVPLVLVRDNILLDSEKFEWWISLHRITHLHAIPSFLVQLKFRKPYHLKRIVSGGDTFPVSLIKEWSKYCCVYNKYGPTETTITSIELSINRNDEVSFNLPIGKPLSNTRVYLLDIWQKPVPSGVVGEMYIGGSGVVRGYLNRPKLTAERFIRIRNSEIGGRLYRTGDLARWLQDGTIEFLGRFDLQIKIRGYRIELGEIENRLLKYPGIKESVTIAREDEGGDKYLCAYVVSERELEISKIRESLVNELPDYMIPSFFVHLEKIPLTSNGKIDRKSLPKPELKASKEYNAPENDVEVRLVELWSEILRVEKDVIGITGNFFQLGGHSLKATILVSKIHKIFEVKVPLVEIFKAPTIRGLAEYIKKESKDSHTSINPVEEKEYYALSSAQKRLYILQQLVVDNTSYNMPYVIPLAERVIKEKLESVFKKLISRHESLRTSFITVNEMPVQRIHRDIEFSIGFYEVREEEVPPLISSFTKPFDLSRAPLLEAKLVDAGPSLRVLVINMHHIITDGISQRILEKDFHALYSGENLPLLRLQYKDYSEWYNSVVQQEAIKRQESYWLMEFSGDIPVLNLPTDYPRPTVQSEEGNVVNFCFDGEETRIVKRIAHETNGTLYMCLLAIFNILLSKLSGQEDIILGTPIAARRHTDLQDVTGMFVNTLAMRNFPRGEKVFKEFLWEVKNRTLAAYENQEYPFEELVDKITVKRDIGRNPVFDVMFNLLNQQDHPEKILQEKEENIYLHRKRTTQFDMDLTAMEIGENVFFYLGYSSRLFKPERINKIIKYFRNILKVLPHNTGVRIAGIEIIPPVEKKQILIDFNNTNVQYPEEKTIHLLFETQVKKTPGRVAGVFNEIHLTYNELNKRANRLASFLRGKGFKPEMLAGLMIERSLEMITGVMAILKSGGAYLPLDPSYPQKRIEFMIKHSEIKLLVVGGDIHKQEKVNFAGEIIDISDGHSDVNDENNLEPLSKPWNLAYVIYTSGSTGRPKGVMVQNDHYANAAFAWRKAYHLDELEVNLLQLAAFSFDVFGGDIVRALLNGGNLVICPENVKMNLALLHQLILKRKISLFEATPALIFPLMDYIYKYRLDLGHLVLLILGSDICSLEDFKKLTCRFGKKLRIINSYGVTEATIDTSFYEAKTDTIPLKGNVPIGKPFPNMHMYILDLAGNLQPIGITGELYIGGKSVAKGYLNNPETSYERFLNVHFIPGEKLYRTGDSARWLCDGNVEFMGRTDQQIKIRGVRIEPGEIENRLLKYPGIKESIVVAQEYESGDKYLCAYVVLGKESEISEIKENLAKELPDYMIPSYFVQLEKIPLTPNGKIDRKSLPVPVITSMEKYIAPRDKVEEKLVEIWEEVLGIKGIIGIKDNFFELGGHSLKATILVTKIQKAFNIAVPLVEFFKTPTVEALARYVWETDAKTFIPGEDRVLKLKTGYRNPRNLFLVHDGTGEVDGYMEFCKHLRGEFNCWGLRADRLENLTPRNVFIQEIARTYIKSIKKIQSQGPYYIAGWSLGGTITFEMAAQLEQMNEEIVLLALIDSPPPHKRGRKNVAEFNLKSELNFINNYKIGRGIEDHFENLDDNELSRFWPFVADYLEANHFDVELVKKIIAELGMYELPNYDRLDIRESIYYLNVGRSLSNARACYIPRGKINTQVYYFKASQSNQTTQNQWQEFCVKPILYYTISGNHFSIFQMPNVIYFSKVFAKLLNQLVNKVKIEFYNEINEPI